jgi:type I restriction enzyme S subunit
MQKYPAYKDSGVEWLGDIPTHWYTLSNKNIFKLKKNQVGKKSCDYVLLSLTLNGVIKRDMENPQGKFPAEFNTYQEVKKGDFIFCLFDVEETPRCVGLSDFDGMITGAYTVMEPYENFERNFLYYFYLNLDADKRLKPLYTGLRNTISKENFFSFKTYVPPLPEQTAIAAFLDRKTTLIDQAIGIKQKQIELLKERRQILIHKAVTRGLNPNVKLKDSGVEWIGEIPEGWTITLLKRFCHKITDGSHHSPQTQFEGRNYISVKDVDSDGNINLINCKKINEKDFKELVRNGSQPKINDILLTKDGTIGRAAIVDKNNDFVALSSLGIITPDLKLVLPQYLSLYLTSEINVSQMFSLIAGSALTRLTIEKINNLITIIPPLNEQFNIINYVKPLVTKIATAISLKEQEIEKLKEYKATLINSAVTGKIKVS